MNSVEELAKLIDMRLDAALAQGLQDSPRLRGLWTPTVLDLEWICEQLGRKPTRQEWTLVGWPYVGGEHCAEDDCAEDDQDEYPDE